MPRGDEIFDWILKRKRCPFCVAPFPVLKCVGFESWQCPKCETEFHLDEDGDLEPFFNEKHYTTDEISNHFPKQSICSNNILCSNCTENQQKIVQLLQSFDTNSISSQPDHRRQYELYAAKLENRYPLCATCSYRVSVQLKKCEEEAGLEERRHTALSGGDWQNKLKLAQKMKWKQFKRKIIKGLFFWPDFLFQLLLTAKCVFKDTTRTESENIYIIYGDNIKTWLPSSSTQLDIGSFYFVICSVLFLLQFNGIALNRRNPFELVPQLFLLSARVIIGNFLYQFMEEAGGVELNSALVMTAVALAIVFKTGSRNAIIRYESPKKMISTFKSVSNETIFSKSKNSTNNPTRINSNLDIKNGFAAYSENHYKYHSFANQVPTDAPKPIMPWSEKPLPGKLVDTRSFNFNENLLTNNQPSLKLRPSKLISDDPLELEPMFSSFSLSDEPKTTRKSALRSKVELFQGKNIKENVNENIKGSIVKEGIKGSIDESIKAPMNRIGLSLIIYNCLLTMILSACRVALMEQTSLISIILALTFGLRGFIWPRLSLKIQLTTLTVAVMRLAWLGAELNEKIGHKFGYFALALDLILIILR